MGLLMKIMEGNQSPPKSPLSALGLPGRFGCSPAGDELWGLAVWQICIHPGERQGPGINALTTCRQSEPHYLSPLPLLPPTGSP